MRKRLRAVLLVVMALVIAACPGGEEAADTTATTHGETTTTERETTTTQTGTTASPGGTTTTGAGGATWTLECNPGDQAMCANLHPVRSTPSPSDREETPAYLEHFCDYYPGQILIQNPEGDPVTDLGLVPVVPEDLFLIGEPGDGEVALMEDVLAFYESRGVFAYKLDVANPTEDQLFDAIIAARDASEGASPHYLLKPAGTWKYGPYDTATNVPGTWQFGDLESTGPGPNDGRLVIIDTGGNGPDTDIGVASSEPERPGEDPRVVGHGTFAASIALQYNPGLSVEIYRASLEDGTMSEATVTGALFRAFDVPPNQETAVIPAGTVVNLSLGTYPCGPDFQPLGLSLSMSNQVVAASGNDGSGHVPDQLYPASHPDVVGVSSLTTGWMNASWANRGEVYAPGEHVVGWYHDGTDGGLAAWSGTSFAAPHRAACIASGYC